MKRTTHSIRWKGSQPLHEINGLHCMFRQPYSLSGLTLESCMGSGYVQEPLNSASFVCRTYIQFYQTYSTASTGLQPLNLSEQRYFKTFLKLGLHLGKPEIWFLENEGWGRKDDVMYSVHGSFILIPIMTHQGYIVSKLIWGPGGYSTSSSFEAARHFSCNASCCMPVSFQGTFSCPPLARCSILYLKSW